MLFIIFCYICHCYSCGSFPVVFCYHLRHTALAEGPEALLTCLPGAANDKNSGLKEEEGKENSLFQIWMDWEAQYKIKNNDFKLRIVQSYSTLAK